MFDLLFDTTSYTPRKDGGGWTAAQISLHVGSDVFIWLAYVSIPLVLLYFARRKEVPYPRLLVLFAAFILTCGFTHVLDAMMFYHPAYRLTGLVKLVTAIISWVTVIVFVAVAPRLMRVLKSIPSRRGVDDPDDPDDPGAAGAWWMGFVVAALAAVLAVLVRWLIDPFLEENDRVFVLPLLAVVYVAWQYGFGPGLVTLVLGMLGYLFFFIAPRESLALTYFGDHLSLGLFFFGGVACAVLAEAQRVARKRMRVALTRAIYQQTELEAEVSRRRAAEEALRAGEDYLLSVQDNTPDCIQVLSLDGRLTSMNRPGQELLEIDDFAAVWNREWESLWDETGRDRAREAVAAAAAGRTSQFQGVCRTAGGTAKLWDVKVAPIPGPDGRPVRIVGVSRDITEQKRTEQAVRRSEATLRAFYNHSPLCMGIVEPLGDDVLHVYDNRAACRLVGVPPDATAGKTATQLGTPPGVVAVWLQKYRESGVRNEAVRFEYPFDGPAGTRWLSATVSPLEPVEDRRLFCYMAEDVTDRKRIEEAVLASEARFRTLAEAMPQIVWVTRPDGYHEYYNRRWYEYTGLTEEESVGWGWTLPLHPDDAERAGKRWEYSTATGEDYDIEYRLRGADGEYRWFVGRALPERNADGVVVRWFGTCTDIHEKRQAAEQVQEAHRFLKSTIDSLTKHLAVLDETGTILMVNKAWQRFAADNGLTYPSHGIGVNYLEVCGKTESGRAAADGILAVISGRSQEFTMEYPCHSPTERRWFLLRVNPFLGDGPVRVVVIHENVTARVRAEEALRASEERFRNLADNIPQFAWTTDATGAITWYNRRWFDYTGTTFDEMKGWGWKAVHHPEHVDRVAEKFSWCVRSGEPWEDTFPLRGKDGMYRWFLSKALPIRDERGDIVLWFGTNTDVTAQRTMENALRESSERFRMLTESIPQVVWTASPAGKVTYQTNRWNSFTGLPYEDDNLDRRKSVIHPDDAETVRKNWQAATAAGVERYSQEYRLRRPDEAEYRWMLSRAVPIRNDEGAVAEWVGTITDIHDQKSQAESLESIVRERTAELREEFEERGRIEQQLRAVATELKRSNEELEKFAYVASHDLQEPLRKIQAFGDRLHVKCWNDMTEQARDYVSRMTSSAERMRRLIDDLLRFSRVTTQARPYARVDLSGVAHDVLNDLSDLVERSQGRVEVGDLPVVEAEPFQMRQLLQNLVANALKFRKKDVLPVVIIAAEVVDAGESVRMCRLTVSDNGIGFDEKYSERIFQVFQRLHGREEYEGTGVGLAICRKIAERHGGTIAARSREGEGSTFVVNLPMEHPMRD